MKPDESTPMPLVEFAANNPHAEIIKEGSVIYIRKAWGVDDFQFKIDTQDSITAKHLGSLLFLPQFDAFFHLDTNEAEFIFSHLSPVDKRASAYVDRIFDLNFQGGKYQCAFRDPTKRLWDLAKCFERSPGYEDPSAGIQLLQFRDVQRIETLAERAQEFFKNKVPRSFIVKPSIPIKEVDWEVIAMHLNFLMGYYDRESPKVVIRQKNESSTALSSVESLRFVEGKFPGELSFSECDEVLLKLIQVAQKSEPRFAFIYCYQILEYAAFYYIDGKAKSALMKMLRNPSFLSNIESNIGQAFAILTETAQNEDGRIQRVVEELSDPSILWLEVEKDREFFSKDVEFEGGFTVKKLIAPSLTSESWCASCIPTLLQNITKIRNCLVHAREKRENKVILPTTSNDHKVAKYLPLVLRLAEQVVMNAKPVA